MAVYETILLSLCNVYAERFWDMLLVMPPAVSQDTDPDYRERSRSSNLGYNLLSEEGKALLGDEVMNEYIQQADSKAKGVTGTGAQVQEILRRSIVIDRSSSLCFGAIELKARGNPGQWQFSES